MATITTKPAEAVGYRGYPNITLERDTQGESASSTFLKGSFVIQDGGYVSVVGSDNDGDLLGIATKAAANNATDGGATSEFIWMVPGLKLEMNLLADADVAYVLAATDWGTFPQWQTQATTLERTLNTTSTTDRFLIVKIGLGAVGDAYGRGGIGDTNARVHAVPVGSACLFSPDV